MSKKLTAHVFLLLANLIYGVSFTIAKDVVPAFILPFGAIVIRVSCSLILFLLCYFIFIREKIKRKDIGLMMTCGLFGVAMNQLLFFKGLSITTPINAALIMTTTPILVVVISNILGKDYLNWQRIVGIILGLCGAITVIKFGKDVSFNGNQWFGDLLVFLNAASYAVYIVIVRPLMTRYHPITVITMVFLFGWMFVMPVGYSEFTMINWNEIPVNIFLELSFIVIATTFFAYLLNIFAMRTASPSVVGIYIYSQPAIASIFAVIMQKDNFSWEKIVATAFIFIGVYMVSFAGRKKLVVIQSAQE